MKNYKLHTSEGVRDYIGEELLIKKEIERRVENLFLSYGYTPVLTPTFEYIDVFSSSGLQQPSLYNLINRQGEVLALRNDLTSSIARIFATKNTNNLVPKKYCYVASTFRYPRLYQGKSHEFSQAGIEIVGSNNIKSDLECIKLAFEALSKINLSDYTVHLGSSAFIEQLFLDLNISESDTINLLSIIENKDFVLLENTLNELNVDKSYVDLVIHIMRNAGKLNFLTDIINKLENKKSVKILNDLKNLYERLLDLGLENKLVFDFSIYSYAKYYTGVTFQIFVGGIGRACVTGGRCDDLLKSFGKDAPMIGFGLDINACLDYIIENNLITIDNHKYLSFATLDSYSYAVKNNNILRANGDIVDVSMFDTLDESIEYAKSMKYKKVLYYNENKLEEIEVDC